MTIGIEFEKGTKVKFIELDPFTWGVDKENANYLKLGNVYTVDRTEIHSFHTKVYLLEVPNIPFNSVWFEEV